MIRKPIAALAQVAVLSSAAFLAAGCGSSADDENSARNARIEAEQTRTAAPSQVEQTAQPAQTETRDPATKAEAPTAKRLDYPTKFENQIAEFDGDVSGKPRKADPNVAIRAATEETGSSKPGEAPILPYPNKQHPSTAAP